MNDNNLFVRNRQTCSGQIFYSVYEDGTEVFRVNKSLDCPNAATALRHYKTRMEPQAMRREARRYFGNSGGLVPVSNIEPPIQIKIENTRTIETRRCARTGEWRQVRVSNSDSKEADALLEHKVERELREVRKELWVCYVVSILSALTTVITFLVNR